MDNVVFTGVTRIDADSEEARSNLPYLEYFDIEEGPVTVAEMELNGQAFYLDRISLAGFITVADMLGPSANQETLLVIRDAFQETVENTLCNKNDFLAVAAYISQGATSPVDPTRTAKFADFCAAGS